MNVDCDNVSMMKTIFFFWLKTICSLEYENENIKKL